MAGSKKEYALGFVIGAKLSNTFKSAFGGAEKQMKSTEQAAKSCGSAFANIGKFAGIAAAGIATAAVGIVAAAYKITDSLAGQGDRAAKTAERLHMTAETYQELEYAFRNAGLGGDEFASIMTKLDATLTKAASSESEAAQWADEYGLSAEKLARMTPEQRIERLADYLNSLKDPLEKDRLALELFGKSGAEMGRVLAMGSEGIQQLRQEAVETGSVMSNEVAAQSEEYEHMKTKLSATIEGIKIKMFSGLIPVFTNVFDKISGVLQSIDFAAMGEKVTEILQNVLPIVLRFGESVFNIFNKIFPKIEAILPVIGDLGERMGSLIENILPSFGRVLESIIPSIEKLIPIIMDYFDTIAGVIEEIVPIIADVFEAVMPIIEAILPLIADIVGQIKPLFKSLMPVVKSVMLVVFKVIEKLMPVVEKVVSFVSEGLEEIMPVVEKVFDVVARVIDAIMPLVENLLDFIIPAIEGLMEFLEPLISGIAEHISLICDIIGAVVDAVVAAITGDWEGFGAAIGKIMESAKSIFTNAFETVKRLARSFVDNILGIFQPIADFFSNVGSFIANLFSGSQTMQVDVQTTANRAGGGSGRSGSIGAAAHAAGGIFSSPHIAQIAEAGNPEAVVPINNNPESHNIWERAGRMAGFTSGGGNISMTMPPISITIEGNADAKTIRQINQASEDLRKKLTGAVRAELAAVERQKARLSYA